MTTPHTIQAAIRSSFWDKVNLLGDCWEWIGARNEAGYGKVSYGKRWFGAHRCSYEYAYGRIPDGLWVLHHCDNPPCVNPTHLFVGTPKDNTQDMLSKGRNGATGTRGSKNQFSKLTEPQVVALRLAFADGETPAELAERFNITPSGANAIIRGKVWTEAGGPICTIDRRGRYKRK